MADTEQQFLGYFSSQGPGMAKFGFVLQEHDTENSEECTYGL